jgi:NCAIR mutase (PurE)-related protein
MSTADVSDKGTRRLLEDLASGRIAVKDAMQRLRLLQIEQVGDYARLDLNRDLRKRVPEVVYAPGKSDLALEAIVRRQLSGRGLSLVSRLDPARADDLRRALVEQIEPVAGLVFDYREDAGVLAVRTPAYEPPAERGCVGLLTAGTSDIPVAEEAALVAMHMGCRVERGYDVGVAGLHRLAEPLSRIMLSGAEVLVVVAGMEGALPSVVGGLVDVPVIGVPTSTGYGLGGDGTAALYSILQTCSPGVVAVNIDNGVGAGAVAALIARGPIERHEDDQRPVR